MGWQGVQISLLKAGLVVWGMASSRQGFVLSNLYSQPVEGNTATRVAALCLSHFILAFRHTLLFAGICPYLQ